MTRWKALLLRLALTDWKTILTGVVLVAFLVVGTFAGTYFTNRQLPSELTIVNRTSRTITSARMRQIGNEINLNAIEPGESRSASFFSREGALTLAVTFDSGDTLSAQNVGYLAPGLPVVVTFDVTDDKVALRNIVRRKFNPQSYKN